MEWQQIQISNAQPDSKLETEPVGNGHTAAPTGKSLHVLIVGCGIAGLVAAISLKKGIPGHDCRGGDGILSCKPSQNVLPSLPLHAMMPVIRSTRSLTRAANRSKQASAYPPTLRASSTISASRKPWNNIPGRDLSAQGGGPRGLSRDMLIRDKWRMAET